MKWPRLFILPGLLLLAAVQSSPAKGLSNGEISQIVAEVLEENHYSRHPLDPELSKRFLDDYLEILDGDHLFLTKVTVDQLVRDHAETLAGEIKAGRITGAWSIYDVYRESAEARLKKIVKFLGETSFDFTSDRMVEIDRAHSPWPLDEAEADKLWHDQIEGEVLDEKLGGLALPECIEMVRGRYEQMQKELAQQTRKDVLAMILSALARAYDPHSDYLTRTDLEDLDSDMRLSMVGIGVVLEPEGRYVRIVGFLPGGPAAADGRLKINDRIVAVAHGNGTFVDIVGMNFNRILELLRVRKGTHVKLKIVSPHGADQSERREVEIVTRKIELTSEVAKAEIIERKTGGDAVERLGWMTLPSFYGDPQHPEDRSASRDVRSLLLQLKKQQISGLVIDLRNNPGGELEEAVDIGGLFLGPVPIVQEKDSQGKVYVSKASVKKIYDGPVVVLTNHLTASAAELLASALKDYNRAVIVGGNLSTYGKGSIQTVVDLAEMIPRGLLRSSDSLGALDLTIGKFYRVSGSSTQLRGLEADLHPASPEDLSDEGESSLKHPLAYDETEPLTVSAGSVSLPIPQLKELSAKRISGDLEFGYLNEDLAQAKKNLEANRLSLNESTRRTEMEAAKKRQQERETARSSRTAPEEKVSELHPEGVRKGGAVPEKKPASARKSGTGIDKTDRPDPVRGEALSILSDLIRLTTSK